MLQEIQDTIASVVERAAPSVVGLGRGWGRGSGFVVASGQLLTNAHVLRGDEVAVTFADGRVQEGSVAGVDADLDVAVIAVDTGDAPVLPWGDVGAVTFGTPVFAVANPGGRGLRATFGFVSATDRSFRGPRGRRIGGSVEHSAPLPRGSSGSPLLDREGRLLGINTIRLDGGLILTVPADAVLRRRVEALGRGETAGRPRLGVALAPPRAARRIRAAAGLPERDGFLVRAVADGSPAAGAGLQRGDLIVAAGGRPLRTFDELFDALDASGGQGTLLLDIVRGTEEREVPVKFGEGGGG
jgi:serine protease Do